MKKKMSLLAAILLYVGLFYFVMSNAVGRSLDFSSYTPYVKVVLRGWVTTILISFVSVALSLVIGLVLYLMAESKFNLLRNLAEIHKTIIFGTPLIVIAIVSYYYIGFAFRIDSKFWVGVLTLGLYIGAYIADIYKGAIEAIHLNQWQTAKMFGFTKYQTYRYIIFPQVLMSILPPLAGQFAQTIKGSALLAYMATSEFLNTITTIQTKTFRMPEGFILIAIGYWIITIPLIRWIRILEKKLNYKV